MHNLIKNAALAAVLSISVAPLANALPVTRSIATPASQPILIAELDSTSGLSPKAEMLLGLFNQFMTMKKWGEEAMKSSDPELRKMGEAMVKEANEEFSKLSKILREEFLKNPNP